MLPSEEAIYESEIPLEGVSGFGSFTCRGLNSPRFVNEYGFDLSQEDFVLEGNKAYWVSVFPSSEYLTWRPHAIKTPETCHPSRSIVKEDGAWRDLDGRHIEFKITAEPFSHHNVHIVPPQ